jgi:hypothetical protein
MRNQLLEKLIENRFQSQDTLRKILKEESKRVKCSGSNKTSQQGRRPKDGTLQLQGVYRGNYYRVKIPDGTQPPPRLLPRFPATAPAPDLSALVTDASSRTTKPTTRSQKMVDQAASTAQALQSVAFRDNAWNRIHDWMVANWGTLVLNFASLCTLVAFTRADVLELRVLSVTGSTCRVVYHALQKSSNWWAVAWPSLFTSVNGYFIFKIFEERNAVVQLTDQQEKIYVEYFMPHGITPKQFERLATKADIIRIPKNSLIIRKNVTTLNHVYLVVHGSTSASILGRHLSSHSVSANPKKSGNTPGGDTGRWIGEMVFLDWLWEKEQVRIVKVKLSKVEHQENERPTMHPVEAATTKASRLLNAAGEVEDTPTAIYTIVAKEDCIIWRWSFDDMEKLMSSSKVCPLPMTCNQHDVSNSFIVHGIFRTCEELLLER